MRVSSIQKVLIKCTITSILTCSKCAVIEHVENFKNKLFVLKVLFMQKIKMKNIYVHITLALDMSSSWVSF